MKIENDQEYENKKFIGLVLDNSLENSSFVECTFTNCDLSQKLIQNCKFENCKFTNCNLSSTNLNNTRLIDCKFIECKLTGIDFRTVNLTLGLVIDAEKSNLNYCVFEGIEIPKSKFIECDLVEADFSFSILHETSFTKSNLERTLFNGADLTDCDFTEAKNYIFNLANCKCKNAKFNYPEVLNLLKPHKIEIV